MPRLITGEEIMTKKYISSALLHIFVFKNCQLWITMKTVEKAHCIVNQEKIGGCNSQKVETLQRGDDMSNDHKSAAETRKTLPPSTL